MPQTEGTSVSVPSRSTSVIPPSEASAVRSGPASVARADLLKGRGRRILTGLFACTLVLLSGCERTDSVQRGYRGTGTLQYYTPSQVAAAAKLNAIPPPEATDPYDPAIPMATEVNENVQVLTDLNALEFARLMQAISTWVSPEQGCEYCHNVENLASDEKYTKVVARNMLLMTRDINTNWKSHVADTGVTCWTCHRGKGVPSDIWFTTPQPKTPSAGISGNKAGQNTAGVTINGYSSLPFDPLTPFLAADTPISVQGTEVLPYGNRQSIKQTEWTYSLMMYMSTSLGVNCTYCHHTRAMGRWDQSSPQRVTAWYGIRMVRALNGDYLEPLKPLYPDARLGPAGDAPKTACATCHKGAYKPLFGVSMLNDYPSLAGVIPGRLKPVEEPTASEPSAAAGGSDAVAMAVETDAAAAEMAVSEESVPADDEPSAEPKTSEAESIGDEVPDGVEVQGLVAQPTQAEVADQAVATDATTEQAEPAEEQVADADAEGAVQEEVPAATMVELATSEMGTTAEPDADATGEAPTKADADAVVEAPMDAEGGLADIAPLVSLPPSAEARMSELETVIDDLRDKLAMLTDQRQDSGRADAVSRGLMDAGDSKGQLAAEDDSLRGALSLVSPSLQTVKQFALALDAAEQRVEAVEARSKHERAALEQRLALAVLQRDDYRAEAEATLSRMEERHAAAMEAAQQRIEEVEARLEQVQDRLEVLSGAQAEDGAEAETDAGDPNDNDLENEAEGAPSAGSVAPSQAAEQQTLLAELERLRQERSLLQQQLEQAVAEPDVAAAAAPAAFISGKHQVALDAAEQRISALHARLEQESTALQQQLDVVRSQREKSAGDVEQRLSKTHATEMAQSEQRIGALAARLEQERLALQQQLEVVRAQRDRVASEVKTRLSMAHEAELDTAKTRIGALQARLEQERIALHQQLEVVREQRDGAADALQARLAMEHAAVLAAMERQVRATRAKLDNQRSALEQQLALVRAQRDAAAQERDLRPTRFEHEKALQAADKRVSAALARLENERTALQQQLTVVRAWRAAAEADSDQQVNALAATHRKKVAELHGAITAREVRQAQEREALQQQLEVVRAQRDAAPAESAVAVAEVAAAEPVESVADSRQSLADTAAELGGQLTEDGVLVSLGGDQLQFASGSAALPAAEIPSLNRTAELLTSRPELTARIEGYTDSAGGAALNQALSRRRAEAVMQALIDRGVAPDRLSAEGLGEEKPIADNGTAQGRSQNRRVEVYLVD